MKTNTHDDQIRIEQTQSLFKKMLASDTFLAIAVLANPDSPHDTINFVKSPMITDKACIVILRTLAEQLENGTMKLPL